MEAQEGGAHTSLPARTPTSKEAHGDTGKAPGRLGAPGGKFHVSFQAGVDGWVTHATCSPSEL